MTELTTTPNTETEVEKTVSVVGSGPVAHELARRLSDHGHAVTYLTAESTPPSEPADSSVEIAAADPTYANELMAAGVGNSDLVLLATGSDATNFLAARIAQTSGANRTVALVEDPEIADAVAAGDVETVDVAYVLGQAVVERLNG